jgi:hypothetical protein
MIGNCPYDFALDRIPGGEFSSISTGSVIHANIRSNIRGAGNIVRCEIFFIHA